MTTTAKDVPHVADSAAGEVERQMQVEEQQRDKEEARKERITRNLCIAQGLMMFSVTTVVPTRAPMVLKIKKGDAAATARAMGMMSGCAAIIELFVNPVLGKLSDQHGRKPFMMLAPIVNAILHSGVAVFPGSLATQFIDRMISGAMIFGFMAPNNAALADLHAQNPTKLGAVSALAGAYFGIGCALGPLIGSKFQGKWSFLLSALAFVGTFLYSARMEETLSLDKRKQFKASDINPLAFLKLFKTDNMKNLTLAALFQSFGDYFNIYDMNNLFMIKVLQYKQAQIGNFATGVGVSQILGGKFTKNFIEKTSLTTTVLFSNATWILGMFLMGSARNTKQAFLALAIWTFGQQRASPVNAYLQKYGAAEGMGKGEIVAAQGNLTAYCKVLIPLFYSNLFAFTTSNGRNIPGSPYFVICVITALAQQMFWRAKVQD